MNWSGFLIATTLAAGTTLAFAQSAPASVSSAMPPPAATGVAPLVRLFELGIAPDQTGAFWAAGQANIGTSVGTEPGTLAMAALTGQDDPGRAYVLEAYTDAAALRTHSASAHFQRFLADTQDSVPDKTLIEVEPQFLREKPTPLALAGAVSDAKAALVRMARITVREQDAAAYRRIVMWEMSQTMDLEPGVLAMYAVTLKGQPQQWVFVEVYADEAASQAHRATPHFRAYFEQTQPMITERQLIDAGARIVMSRGELSFVALGK